MPLTVCAAPNPGRFWILIVVVMTLLSNASCSRTPVEFDSLTLTIEGPMDVLPGLRNAWVHGHAVNRSNSFITNVIVSPEIVGRTGEVTAIESTLVLSVYLEPGQDTYFHSGGFTIPEAAAGQGARPHLRFGYINWNHAEEFWKRQVELRGKLTFADIHFRTNDNGIALQGRLRNGTQADTSEVFATVAFLDARGQLIEAGSFSVQFTSEQQQSADFDVYLSGEWPRPTPVAKAVPRVDYFVERGSRVPQQVPVPPSVR